MKLEVSSSVIDAMLREAAKAAPHEACGVLLGHLDAALAHIVGIKPAANVATTPDIHFEIDLQTLIDCHRAARSGGPAVVGYYHSHPAGPASPSATDRAQAAGDRRVWAIIGEGQVRFWHDTADGFAELSCVIIPG